MNESSNDKKVKFEFAPREKILFLGSIEALVLRLLHHPEALVSDESLIWDFCVEDADRAISPALRPHYYIFERTFRRGPFNIENLNDKSKWETERYEAKALPFKKMVTRKILRHTGVDITPIFDEYLPVIFHFIATNIPEENRKKIFYQTSNI